MVRIVNFECVHACALTPSLTGSPQISDDKEKYVRGYTVIYTPVILISSTNSAARMQGVDIQWLQGRGGY